MGSPGDVGGAHRMREARVLGAVKDQVHHGGLANAAQPLEHLGVDDGFQQDLERPAGKRDVTVDGIAEDAGAAGRLWRRK